MHIVTGGAGFIGSNLVRALADRGHDDIVVVDDLEDGHKFVNFSDLPIADYLDKDEFLERLASDKSFAKARSGKPDQMNSRNVGREQGRTDHRPWECLTGQKELLACGFPAIARRNPQNHNPNQVHPYNHRVDGRYPRCCK